MTEESLALIEQEMRRQLQRAVTQINNGYLDQAWPYIEAAQRFRRDLEEARNGMISQKGAKDAKV